MYQYDNSLEFEIYPKLDEPPAEVVKGLGFRSINFPAGPAQGCMVTFCIEDFILKIFPFYELINSSFNPKWGYSPAPEKNLGINIFDFFERKKPEAQKISQQDIQNCRFACNTLHTNFVRGNGFVITDGELVYKPPGAVALDGSQYRPLGYYPDSPGGFDYEMLVLSPSPPRLQTLQVVRNIWQKESDIHLAISGPAIVRSFTNVTGHISFRLRTKGQTVGNEVNYNPLTEKTSFTIFGVERDTENLIVLSMFAGNGRNESDATFFMAEEGTGITLSQIAELMIKLGASEAIVGGGAGDTQQYVYQQGIWVGQPRQQPDRPQVSGVRGLGAIFALLLKNEC